MLSERRRQYLEAIGIDLWVQRPRGISATQEPARPEPVTTGPRAAAAVTSGEAAAQWQELLEEVRRCTLCPLHTTRTQGVLGVGPKRADWLRPASCSMRCCAPSDSTAIPTSTSPTC